MSIQNISLFLILLVALSISGCAHKKIDSELVLISVNRKSKNDIPGFGIKSLDSIELKKKSRAYWNNTWKAFNYFNKFSWDYQRFYFRCKKRKAIYYYV